MYQQTWGTNHRNGKIKINRRTQYNQLTLYTYDRKKYIKEKPVTQVYSTVSKEGCQNLEKWTAPKP